MRAQSILPTATLLFLSACASTGATINSGVGERFLAEPPYRAGGDVPATASIMRLPVSYQQGAEQSATFDPSGKPGSPMAALLAEMNAFADSLVSGRLGSSGIVAMLPEGTPPNVQFGCVTDVLGDCADPDEAGPAVRSSSTEQPRMRLAVGRPSRGWIESNAAALGRTGADLTLILTLETGQYWITKEGWANRKSLELGTGYTVRLPWLTALDAPISVLQLTGATVAADGRSVRIGAEGLIAKRTGIIASGMGMQALVSDEDVERLRTLRRDDLPGQPLVWQVALRHLVADLTGRPELAVR